MSQIELDPGNNYAILDPDTNRLYIAGSYADCLLDMPYKEYKHLLNTGIYGQCTPEGKWIPGRVTYPEQESPSLREKQLVKWTLVITFSILFLYWFLGQYLGWLG